MTTPIAISDISDIPCAEFSGDRDGVQTELSANRNSLSNVMPSPKGYLLRPFVELSGQRDGYMWFKGFKGTWRSFLTTYKKAFTLENTGKNFFRNFYYFSLINLSTILLLNIYWHLLIHIIKDELLTITWSRKFQKPIMREIAQGSTLWQ